MTAASINICMLLGARTQRTSKLAFVSVGGLPKVRRARQRFARLVNTQKFLGSKIGPMAHGRNFLDICLEGGPDDMGAQN